MSRWRRREESREPTAAEQRADGKFSLDSKLPGGRFTALAWYIDDADAIWQAGYMRRNFPANEYRVRAPNGKVLA